MRQRPDYIPSITALCMLRLHTPSAKHPIFCFWAMPNFTIAYSIVITKSIKNEPDRDFRLAGIASSLKEYKLCFCLNQLLNCDLVKLNDLAFEPADRTRKVQFSVFKSGTEEDKNQIMVFGNKNLGDFLLPEVSQFDYIIRIGGRYSDEEMLLLVNGIRALPEVLMSTEIPLKKIKSKDRLIYEEEKPVRKRLSFKRA